MRLSERRPAFSQTTAGSYRADGAGGRNVTHHAGVGGFKELYIVLHTSISSVRLLQSILMEIVKNTDYHKTCTVIIIFQLRARI